MSETPWRPNLTDVVVAVTTAIVLLLLTLITTEEGAQPVDGVAYFLLALFGLVLLWRRRFPVVVMVASLVVVYAYHALGYPAIGNLPLAVALFNASYYAATIPAAAVATVATLSTIIWFLLGESRPLTEAINLVIRDVGIMAAMILIGSVLRSRQQLAEESEMRLRLVKADQEAQSARRLTEERIKIAREIHDVVAHTVAVIGVQAKVAMETFHDSPDEAERALKIINDSTRDATSELRATIGVLRSQPSLSPSPRLDQLEELFASVSSGGLNVELAESGARRDLSGLVELVAYRVVQEALTNVVKHANATKARVEVQFQDTAIVVSISDDGIGREPTAGYGIAGMRERVEAVGGDLSITPADMGGIKVMARIPIGESR